MNNNNTTQIPPQAPDAEVAVLGALVQFAKAYDTVPYLTTDCFFDMRHKRIFEAVRSLASQGRAIDILTVPEEMKRLQTFQDGDNMYVIELTSSVCTYANIEYHVAVLMDRMKRRAMIALAKEMLSKAYEPRADICAIAEDASIEMTNISCNDVSSSITMKEASEQMMERIMKALDGVEQGVPTGFPELDSNGGFCLGDLIVIGADTSVGKSALAWTIANNAARKGAIIGYITMEMSPAQLCGRSVAHSAVITSSRITNPATSGQLKLTSGELSLICNVTEEIKQLPILISEASSDEKVFSQIKIWAQRNKVKGVFVDYLQILATMNKKFNTETEFLTHVSRRLKQLAKELNIFICVLSQFSRPQGMSKSPDLTRLRGSQEIASAADMVMLLLRPEQDGSSYPNGFEKISTRGTALIDIKKGRNVGTGKFVVSFCGETAHFAPIIGEPPLAANDPPANTATIKIDNVFGDI